MYQDAVSVATKNDNEKWNKAVFWVFDAPGLGNKPFEVSKKQLHCLIKGTNECFERNERKGNIT